MVCALLVPRVVAPLRINLASVVEEPASAGFFMLLGQSSVVVWVAAPPPGVSISIASPGSSSTCAQAPSSSTRPSARTTRLTPGCPRAARHPEGARASRPLLSTETVMASKSGCAAPRRRPHASGPCRPEPWRMVWLSSRTGKRQLQHLGVGEAGVGHNGSAPLPSPSNPARHRPPDRRRSRSTGGCGLPKVRLFIVHWLRPSRRGRRTARW